MKIWEHGAADVFSWQGVHVPNLLAALASCYHVRFLAGRLTNFDVDFLLTTYFVPVLAVFLAACLPASSFTQVYAGHVVSASLVELQCVPVFVLPVCRDLMPRPCKHKEGCVDTRWPVSASLLCQGPVPSLCKLELQRPCRLPVTSGSSCC